MVPKCFRDLSEPLRPKDRGPFDLATILVSAPSCFCCRPENRPCSRAHFHAMTFLAQSSYVDTPSYHQHHNIITQSSCNDLRMSSYVDRDTQGGYGGGGWGGGGDNDVRYDIHHVTLSSPSHHHAIIMPSLNAMTFFAHCIIR